MLGIDDWHLGQGIARDYIRGCMPRMPAALSNAGMRRHAARADRMLSRMLPFSGLNGLSDPPGGATQALGDCFNPIPVPSKFKYGKSRIIL